MLLVTEPGGALENAADQAEHDMIANARAIVGILGKTRGELESADEFDFVVTRLIEALTDLINVAVARGERLVTEREQSKS